VIAPNQQVIRLDLAGCVAITDVPRQTRQISGDAQQRP
jgi:hypothetical protein